MRTKHFVLALISAFLLHLAAGYATCAPVTIDFEDWQGSADLQNIYGRYADSGVIFEDQAWKTLANGQNLNPNFPPNSGDWVASNLGIGANDGSDLYFITPVQYVSGYFTTNFTTNPNGLLFEIYGLSNNLVGSTTLAANYLGEGTPNAFLRLSYAGGISKARFIDSGNNWTMDDLSFSVPESGSSFLLASGLFGLFVFRRKFKE